MQQHDYDVTNNRSQAVLNAIADAILRAPSREGLFQLVCDAAVTGTWLAAMAVLVPNQDGELRIEASAISPADPDPQASPLTDASSDLAESAFRSKTIRLANQYAADAPATLGYPPDPGQHSGTAAAVPMLIEDQALGVVLFYFDTPHCIGDALALELARIAGNLAFKWDRLARDERTARFNLLVATLSATNETLMRADNRSNLYQLICETVVNGGNFAGVSVSEPDDTRSFFRYVAGAGTMIQSYQDYAVPLRDEDTSKLSTSGIALLTGKTQVCNDLLKEYAGTVYFDVIQAINAQSMVSVALGSRGKAIAVMNVTSAEVGTFTPDLVTILERLAANVSFAFENFERAEERKLADDRIRHLATHDSLTNLPNRATFNELLGNSLRAARRYHRRCAVLFVDLDRFKVINDSLGHAAGDRLLVEVASRLRSGVRADDVVARLGGDEFMVLLNEISDAEEVRGVARNLVAILGIPVELNGHECHVTGSIGIAIFPQDGTDVDTLMRHADTAMYLAKTEGKNDVRFFSADIGAQSSGRLAMEADLRQALHRGEFTLVYQPKVDVESRQISGVEALLRWNHPTMGMISPMDFIPVAEETGLIIAIGRWVLNTACLQFTRWQAEALPVKSIAVNVSPRQFSDEYLLADIDSALGACGMDPRHLQIEITENMVLLNVERAIRTLNAIQSRGVRVAIDDFGTGYSSMSMLKRFPIDIIKIDQSFVRDLPHNAADNAIARAIIDMGKALGLMIVAEGVETPEQNAFLRVHACDEVQGFLFSKPVAASEILALFKIQDQAALAAGTDVRSQA